MPSFLDKRTRFTLTEGEENTEIAKVSVHVERAFQRIKVFHALEGTLGRNLMSQANKTIICSSVNLQAPIIASDEV